jgi:N-acetylneuraminic acid mutarotase
MNIARNTHSAVLLQDGRVLITGGVCLAGLQPTNTSEIYDPTTEKFTNTGSLNFARCSHKSYLLSSGKILIIGGHNPASLTNTNVDILSQSEIYDPQTGQFTLSGNEVIPRTNFRDYVFPNGSILLLGGFTKDNTYLSSTEIFNVNTSTFSLSSNMNFNKLSFGVSALCNGQLLTTGGISFNNSNKSIAFYSNAEIYDPVTSSFSISSASMSIQRYDHSNTILNDCSVLIAGGGNSFTSPYATNKAEIYDATQKKFITVGNLNDARKSHTATMLNNGKVLIVGGTIDY